MDLDTVLEQAREAIRTRGHFSAFPESPSPRVYGQEAAGDGRAAFEAHLGRPFAVRTPGASGTVTTEDSPFGQRLDVEYPHVNDLDEVITAARAGMGAWRDAGPDGRLAACFEILTGLHDRIFELANAVMATTGQAFVMAFQAGGAHALDRALESVVLTYDEMKRWPDSAVWEKPAKGEPLRMEKEFTVVPRGVSALIGCNTFPTWNSYPGLFASLMAGNPVVVKPHPRAVLPLAITVQVCQNVLQGKGFDPCLVTLAAEHPGDELAKDLVRHPAVKLVDFTGGSEFGRWIEENAAGATVFTEKSGVNTVVIDSTDSFKGMCSNLAFTLSLYSGQMCTTTQTIFVPESGISTEMGEKTFDEVAAGIAAAVDGLLSDEKRAVEILGAVVNDDVLARSELAPRYGTSVLASRALSHADYPDAVIRTPAISVLDAEDVDVYGRECFGPVTFIVRTPSTARALELVRQITEETGAMTFGVYSTSDEVLAAARTVALDAGAPLSENLTDGVYVNQTAAYSDFHGTGVNPAANTAFTDASFVTDRFRVVQIRRHAPS